MLFFFSGTGNSEFVATTLANFLNQKKLFIPEINPHELQYPDDRIIFVFPVYSWGVAPLIEHFIYSLPSSFINEIKDKDIETDCVMICGDEVALAPEMFESILKKVGIKLRSVWSVIMPNNYVLLPGFDVDSKQLEQQKLDNCKGRIMEIAQSLSRSERRTDVVRGSMPWLKTKLVFPLFKRWGIFPKKWYSTPSCISCGRCEAVCPLCNVKMNNAHPVWGSRCCSCLACYHICPVHAVQYGSITRKKGQYFFPLKKISSHRCHK